MIIAMARVRIAGPSALAEAALRLLQDIGDLHLITAGDGAREAKPSRTMRQARRLLTAVESALALLPTAAAVAAPVAPPPAWPEMAVRVRQTRHQLASLERRGRAIADEQALLQRYQSFLQAFAPLIERMPPAPDARASFVLLREGSSVAEIEANLRRAAGDGVAVLSRPLPSGETALLLLASGNAATRIESLLALVRLDELPTPPGLGQADWPHALPALQSKLAQLQHEREAIAARRKQLGAEVGNELIALQARLQDLLLLEQAQAQVRKSELLFVIEGWMPAPGVAPLRTRLARELGPEIIVITLATEPWTRADAPVALVNPPLFRPFELITRAFPLPRYGSIDPTPFVAVFFPMFVGLMLGDVGYGLVLALLAVWLRRRSPINSTPRAVAEMGLGCALFSIIFGVLFGEFFGTLGAQWGMKPLVFDREHALAPFLLFTIALGAVHVVLGLALGLVGAWRQGERRKALGRGVTILMIGLTAAALLAAFQVLPQRLFTPAVIAVLVAFPILVALEGIIAVIELMSAFGHILSYARIMALGTASLLLAMIANRMAGALGSVLVGVAFALLFHLVNFAIGLFSPTIHALRLHYVEFFGEFYSPGGTAYRPLSHWRGAARGASP